MELSDDGNVRSKLFGVRGAFQLFGYALPIGVQMFLNGFMAEDVPLQFTIMGLLFASWSMGAWMNLLCVIRERPPTTEKPVKVPIVPHARRLLANQPYINYLLMRMPLNLTSLMPSNLIAYYV